MADSPLPPAMTVRAQAMRLAIECARGHKDSSFSEVMALAEVIEPWLWDAKAPTIMKPGTDHFADVRKGTEVNGHA